MEIPVFCCCWTTRTHTRFQNTEIDISVGFNMQATIADNRISLINYALPVPGAREMCSLQSLRAEQGSSEQLPRDWQLEAATGAGMTVSGARARAGHVIISCQHEARECVLMYKSIQSGETSIMYAAKRWYTGRSMGSRESLEAE